MVGVGTTVVVTLPKAPDEPLSPSVGASVMAAGLPEDL